MYTYYNTVDGKLRPARIVAIGRDGKTIRVQDIRNTPITRPDPGNYHPRRGNANGYTSARDVNGLSIARV